MTGLLSTRNVNAVLVGDKSLSKRPMKRIIDPLTEMHTLIEHNNGKLPLKIKSNNFFSIPIKYKLLIGSAAIKVQFFLQQLLFKVLLKLLKKIHLETTQNVC